MAESLHYTRVFADAAGESHLEQCELEMGMRRFAPPAPPLDVSAIQSADGLAVLRLPPHWWGEWHPSPYRQWLFFMSGSACIQVSDGTQREVSPGSIVLLEDTYGRGYQTRVSASEVVIASVRQPEP